MKNGSVEIYDLIETLTVEERKDLIRYLQASIRESEEKASELTYLETEWQEIRRLMKELDHEPYIDGQPQIEEIYDICKEVIGSGRIGETSWEIRKKILSVITGGEFFDCCGICDPMKDLFKALCLTREEKLSCADMVFRTGSEYMKKKAARLYLEGGRPEKYYEYMEEHLGRKAGPYEEIIGYYWDRDREKAIALAESAMKKHIDDLTGIMVYLMKDALDKGDAQRYEKLLQSAKARSHVDQTEVLRRLGKAGV